MGASDNNGLPCAICRFMRALAFSGIGAAVGGLTAKWLGADLQTIMLAAFFCALFLVIKTSQKPKRR
jgi:uncharacterized membrane protein YfcA